MIRPLLLSVLALSACKSVDPAPKELDALFHYAWEKYADGADEELAAAAINFHDAVSATDREEGRDGTLKDLSAEQIGLVGVEAKASNAQGLFLVNRFACDLDQLEEILSYKDQASLYEGTYARYDRSFEDGSSRDAFLAHEDPTLSWGVDYRVEDLVDYDATIQGGLRRVPILDEEQSPHGALVWARTYMPKPATFDSEKDNLYFDQDYQIELYYEAGGGDLLHFYAIWREVSYTASANSDSEDFQRILLNNLADWDDDTAALCADGRP